ncbi:unnamed protein product, partial [Closterium sp. Naga37s-1]
SQMASPTFTHVFAPLVTVVNTKFPELGELLLKRIILQFRMAFRRNDKPVLVAACRFLAHLVNQQVAHEIVALDLPPLLAPYYITNRPFPTHLPLTAAGAGGGVSLPRPSLQPAGGTRDSRARAASLPRVSAPPTPPTPPSPFLLQPVLVAACRFLAHVCNQQPVLVAACRFLAHLCNQQVAHEIVALELLTLLLETPTDDSVEVYRAARAAHPAHPASTHVPVAHQVAVSLVKGCCTMLHDLRLSPPLPSLPHPITHTSTLSTPDHFQPLLTTPNQVAVSFVKECGAMLQDLSPQGLHSIFERFRGILHEGEIDKRVQFTIEGLFAIRKAKFEGLFAIRKAKFEVRVMGTSPQCCPAQVGEGDQILHELSTSHAHPAGLMLTSAARAGSGGGGGSDHARAGNLSRSPYWPHAHLVIPHPPCSPLPPCPLFQGFPALDLVEEEDEITHELGFPTVLPELDLVEEEDQITHELSLEEPYDPETSLDVFKFDPDYLANEQRYKEIKAEILGDEEEEEDDKGEKGDDDEEEEDEESSEEEEDEEEQAKQQEIRDETETNLVNLRRTIYLTIMASVNFEEAGHKLMKVNLQPGQESEGISSGRQQKGVNLRRTIYLTIMASVNFEEAGHKLMKVNLQPGQEVRGYGGGETGWGEDRGMLNRAYQECFEQCFVKQYSMIHRLETNKLRNVAKLFAHFLATDAMPWALLSYIRLTEEDTSSSSRIFIKIMFQEMSEQLGLRKMMRGSATIHEMSEQLGLRKMNERLSDPTMGAAFDGIFPKDTPKNTRFAINFFTSIGLGGLTDNLREHLKNMPKLIMQQQKPVQVQGLLDQNRLLIHEIKANHEARLPDGLMRNVTLIRELNSNVTKVVDLYADISRTFVRTFGSSAAARASPGAAGGDAAAAGAVGGDSDG